MDAQRLGPTYNSSVPIQDVALRTYRKWWMIERGGGRGSGRSMLMAWHDDDDDGMDEISKWTVKDFIKVFLVMIVLFCCLLYYFLCFSLAASEKKFWGRCWEIFDILPLTGLVSYTNIKTGCTCILKWTKHCRYAMWITWTVCRNEEWASGKYITTEDFWPWERSRVLAEGILDVRPPWALTLNETAQGWEVEKSLKCMSLSIVESRYDPRKK